MTNTPIQIERGPELLIDFCPQLHFDENCTCDFCTMHICHIDEHGVCAECHQIALERIMQTIDKIKPAQQLSPLGEMFADEMTI